MSVFVTGGTGCPGRAVVRGLLEAGHRVALLASEPAETPEPDPRLVVYPGDVASMDDLGMAVRASGAHTVLHLAGLDELEQADPRAYQRVNLASLDVLIQLASMGAVQRLLYTSTVLALGPTDGEPGNEDREPTALVGSRWLESRAQALQRVREAASMGCPVTTLLTGVVYGPRPEAGEAAPVLTRLLSELQTGRRAWVSAGRGCRLCVASEADVVRGHLLALERGQTGREYILGGPNLTIRQWCEITSRVAGRRPARTGVPYHAVLAAGVLARLTGRSPALPPELLRLLHNDWAFSSQRAEQELGYAITPLEDALGQRDSS